MDIKFAYFCGFDKIKIIADGAYSGDLTIKDDGEVVTMPFNFNGEGVVDYALNPQHTYKAKLKDGDEVTIQKFKLYDDEEFGNRYNYDGELGAAYSKEKTDFAVWAPFATQVALLLYESGETSRTRRIEKKMTIGDKGVWRAEIAGDLKGKFYTYAVTDDGEVKEVVDPYAVAVNANGSRGAITDLKDTDPKGWEKIEKPKPVPFCEYVIYEAHVRDLSISQSSHVTKAHRGKYLALTEKSTSEIKPLDYISGLGVTAVHFQPVFDFASVNENFSVATRDKKGEYNWGYDPLNYNAPEGSYSTDPTDPLCRITELKQMVMALHQKNIRVIFDMVYNHVYDAKLSNFQALCPNYYFRTDFFGNLLNGSGCGNETASERYMVRRFLLWSTSYWAREYKIDGMRFDLMALHDVDTMNAIYDTLNEITPGFVIYGEGWDAGTNGLPEEKRASKANAYKMPNIAFFNDAVRDGIRGSVFNISEPGFITGKGDNACVALIAAAGGTDILSEKVYDTIWKKPFASRPSQNVNYASCHDNATLWDKINASCDESADTAKAMNRLSCVIVMTGQGASFMLAGEEFMRSKTTLDFKPDYPFFYKSKERAFVENSYDSPDSVNELNYSLAEKNGQEVDFYRGLIAIKRNFPQFHIADYDTLKNCLYFGRLEVGIACYAVRDPASSEFAFVAINALKKSVKVEVPQGEYKIHVAGRFYSADKNKPIACFMGSGLILPPICGVVMTATLSQRLVDDWAIKL